MSPRTRPTPTVAALAACAAALLAGPTTAYAQDAERDSLEARVAELEARLDSVTTLLAELHAMLRADTAGPDTVAAPAPAAEDELARLRREAREAAAEAAGADTAPPENRASRTRDLQILNPEISVTGDVVGNYADPAGESGLGGFTPREFEFSFQAALDPYTRTKIFLTREEEFEVAGLEEALEGSTPDFLDAEEEGHGGEIDLEEGYLYWVGLPASLGVKLGKFRQEIGRYNRWHTHALLDVERPLAAMHFLGEDGLIQTGASLTSPSVSTGAGTHALTFEATAADNAVLFQGGDDLSWLAHLNSFWDLGPGSYLELGATGLAGHNDGVAEGVDLDTRLLAFDAAFRWTPPGRGLYRDLRLAAEWYLAEKDFGGVELTGHGGYLQGNYRLDRRWIVGARADWLDGFGDGPRQVQLAPSLTWWQSEWVRLRLQYNWLRPEGGDANHTLLLQTVWAVGPHKHESY